MGIEIERKFLVRMDKWTAPAEGTRYRQGYLSLDPERIVRVRLAGDAGFLTIKGASKYTIPANEAQELLEKLCLRPLIEKIRYKIQVGSHLWEIDEFFGENAGLWLAEVELASLTDQVELPPWVGCEVTDDPRYYNAALIRHPYRSWGQP